MSLLNKGENVWKENITGEAYHEDRTAVNSSCLRLMLKSPASFHASFFEGVKEKPSEAKRIGAAVHVAVLEPERFKANFIVEPDFGDLRSAKNRQARDEWKGTLKPEAVVVKDDELTMFTRIAENISNHIDAFALLKSGLPELSGYYNDSETGVRCRVRPDFLSHDSRTLVDLKTTQDCTLKSFSKSIWNYGYQFQISMYLDAVKHISGRSPDVVAFIAVEKSSPYEVSVYTPDAALLEVGNSQYRKALDLLRDCLSKNEWPKYQKEMQSIGLPSWALYEEQ